jgi:hypothetical protein
MDGSHQEVSVGVRREHANKFIQLAKTNRRIRSFQYSQLLHIPVS